MTTTIPLICGEKINDWMLINAEGERHWLCRCKCGIEKKVNKYTLKNGLSKRCRTCSTKERKWPKFAKDISGNKYASWTVISRADGEFNEPYWNCQCKCGNKRAVSGSSLRKGKSKRCKSCASREKFRPLGLKIAKDLKNKKFGKWTVLERSTSINGRSRWLCKCQCGTKYNVLSQTLLDGRSTRCIKCSPRTGNVSHGLCRNGKKPEYFVWRSIKDRCFNPNTKAFKNYGVRGISICEKWKNSFEAFYKYMGSQPFKGSSIDRIDNNGNYEPGNVRWATRKQQMANTRKQKHGVCVKQWSQQNNLDRFHVAKMLEAGKSLEEIKFSDCPSFRDYENGYTAPKKWATKHERCICCEKTDTKHFGYGLCRKCYQRKRYRLSVIETGVSIDLTP